MTNPPSAPSPIAVPGCYLGIDFGTSGARAIAINASQAIQAEARCAFSQADPHILATTWREALFDLLGQIPLAVRNELRAIAINGTSGTVLWCDEAGHPIESPILYDDDRGQSVLGILRAIAPPHHTVVSATSSLAKLLWWSCRDWMKGNAEAWNRDGLALQSVPSIPSEAQPQGVFVHQADWLAFLLHGQLGVSDYHNSLKLGFDVGQLCYPDWMQRVPTRLRWPTVVAPGTPIGAVQPGIAERFDLPSDCQVCAGTTDSIAAFLASGVEQPGEAVTSLGSTLVIKLLSETRVDDVRYGVYSHRLGTRWLVGGASNTGGAVLRQFFSAPELETLSHQINPQQPTRLNYYPLPQPGERFPVNDPTLEPHLTPRPADDSVFLQGLFEGMARIEAEGYRLLMELGATPLTQVYTAGGGAQNAAWTAIRQRYLGVPVGASAQTEAAYGTTRLALKGVSTA